MYVTQAYCRHYYIPLYYAHTLCARCDWYKIKEYVFASGPPSVQRVENYYGAPCIYYRALVSCTITRL